MSIVNSTPLQYRSQRRYKQNSPAAAEDRAPPASRAPPSSSLPSSRAQKQADVETPKNQAPTKPKKQVGSHKSPKVDRNALSARSTGNLLSEAALAAQARVDANKEPAQKRRRLASKPSHAPSPLCTHGSPRALDNATDAEVRDLVAVAERNDFPTPTTPDEAAIFLRAIMGLELCVEGSEIVGCNILNGTNYSTAGGPDVPLPPGARAAFMLAHADDEQLGWQTVPSKGKRGRGA